MMSKAVVMLFGSVAFVPAVLFLRLQDWPDAKRIWWNIALQTIPLIGLCVLPICVYCLLAKLRKGRSSLT